MYCSHCGEEGIPGAAFCSSCGKHLFNDGSLSHHFQIGDYVVGRRLQSAAGLTEFSPTEYRIFGRHFKKEKDYHGAPVQFLSRSWKLMLGTIDGRVYKMGLCFESVKELEARAVADDAFLYCATGLGAPINQSPGFFTWDASDGNVVIQMAEMAGTYAVNIFLTSSLRIV